MRPAIRLVGLPSDSNSSFERGPALAPAAIRAALWSDRGNLACENGMDAGMDERAVHARGDISGGEDMGVRGGALMCVHREETGCIRGDATLPHPARRGAAGRGDDAIGGFQ